MKKAFVLIVSILSLFFVGCYDTGEEELLERIEKLWVQSDSSLQDAIEGAASMEEEMLGASEGVKMKYSLLNIRLRDKQDIIPESDDSIKKVVAYYERHGSVQDKVRAYHYMSSVYRDLHDSPRAIVNGLKALELAKSADETDSLMLMHLYSNMSALYRRQLNTQEAIRMALGYLQLYPDDPWAMMDVASAYREDIDSANACKYYEKVFDVIRKDDCGSVMPSYYVELLDFFMRYDMDDKVSELVCRLNNLKVYERPSNFDFALGLYYKKQNNQDSALFCFESQYEKSQNWVGKCDAAEQIMECYHTMGDYAKASAWAMVFRNANDSVIAERRFDLTRNALAEYHYQKDVEEETRMRLKTMNMQRWLLGVMLLSLLMAVTGYACYIRKRQKLEKQISAGNMSISRLRKEVKEKEESVAQVNSKLNQVHDELDEKTGELTSVVQSMVEKQRELIGMKEKLGKRELEMAELETRLVETDNQINKLQYELAGKSMMNKELIKELVGKELMEMNTDILELFDKSLTHRVTLSESQWRGFFANMDAKHPDFKEQVEERVPRLNVPLLRTAYLMMAGLTNQQIESIMGVSRQTQWERAKKLETFIGDLLPFRRG